MPTEGKFFDLFIQHGELCVKGGKELVSLMTNFDDLEHRVHAIETIEKQADKVTHATLEMLHKGRWKSADARTRSLRMGRTGFHVWNSCVCCCRAGVECCCAALSHMHAWAS